MIPTLSKRKRTASLDIVRIIAIIMVVVIHGVETVWDVHPATVSTLPIVEKIIIFILYTFGRLGVPLFLFLTGYLMLGRKYNQNNIISFYKKRVVRLIVIALIWTLIYYVYSLMFRGRVFHIADLARQLLFISDYQPAPHLWYMPAIIGLYLFIPFVANVLSTINKKALKIILSVSIFYLFIVPTCNSMALALHISPLISKIELHYVGGICGVMMVIGCLVKQYNGLIISKLHTSRLILLFLISITLSIATHYYMMCIKMYDAFLWYDSIFILIAAGCLFILLIELLNNKKESKVLAKIARMVFGCYLVHYLFIYIIKSVLLMIGYSNGIGNLVIIVIGSLAMSLAATSLASRYKLPAQLFGVK